MSLRKITSIARRIRKAFEEIESKEGEYNDGDLGGYCGRASVQLYLACKRQGIKIQIAEGVGHIFNVYNGRIVDITATQFGYCEKVFIKDLYHRGLDDCHRPIRYHHSAKTAEKVYGSTRDTIRDKRTVLKYLEK